MEEKNVLETLPNRRR